MTQAVNRSMARVLVTGATGFLGRHVLLALERMSDISVIPMSRKQALPGGLVVREYGDCPQADVLIHLAEEPDRAKVNRESDAYARHSDETMKALLAKFGGRVIYASSGVVYGDQGTRPFGVDAPTHGIDTYAQSKLVNEKSVLDSGGCVVRLSNLIGPGMSPNNVVSDILAQVPGKGPVRVRDDGPVRDYLAVADAATALAMLAVTMQPGILNVGSGVGTSVRQLAWTVLSIAGQTDRDIVATAPGVRPSVNVLDITATTAAMGWRPVRTLQAELAQLMRSNAGPIDE